MDLPIKALSPKIGGEIPYPFYASAGAAAMDLHACLDGPLTIGPGDRIAQLSVVPVVQVRPVPVEDLDETDRGSGGFGSTGA